MKITNEKFKSSLHIYADYIGDDTEVIFKSYHNLAQNSCLYLSHKDLDKFKEAFDIAYLDAKERCKRNQDEEE